MGQVFVGHDWAEDHHDIQVQDGEGRQLARARLAEGVEGIAKFHALLAEHVEDPAEVVIASETDRGLFVAALIATGYQVYAINPASTATYRTRHSTSGRSPIRGMRRCWPIWPAPTGTTTGPWPATAS